MGDVRGAKLVSVRREDLRYLSISFCFGQERICYGKFWIIDNPELFCTIFIGLEKLIGRAENLESVPTKLDRAWE